MLATTYVESLRRKYRGFDFPRYKLRKWFSEDHQVFFDCESDEDRIVCLDRWLKRTDLEAFTVFFVVKEPIGAYKLTDAAFRKLGTETLEHFVNRYHQQLEPMTRLGIHTVSLEYIECIRHSYKEPAE